MKKRRSIEDFKRNDVKGRKKPRTPVPLLISEEELECAKENLKPSPTPDFRTGEQFQKEFQHAYAEVALPLLRAMAKGKIPERFVPAFILRKHHTGQPLTPSEEKLIADISFRCFKFAAQLTREKRKGNPNLYGRKQYDPEEGTVAATNKEAVQFTDPRLQEAVEEFFEKRKKEYYEKHRSNIENPATQTGFMPSQSEEEGDALQEDE